MEASSLSNASNKDLFHQPLNQAPELRDTEQPLNACALVTTPLIPVILCGRHRYTPLASL